LRSELWVVYAMLGAYAVSVMMFYIFARYRFPLVPFLVLFASIPVAFGLGLVASGLSLVAPGFRVVASGFSRTGPVRPDRGSAPVRHPSAAAAPGTPPPGSVACGAPTPHAAPTQARCARL